MGGRSMKEVGAQCLLEAPSLLGRERAAVDVDVGPERRSPRVLLYSLVSDARF